MRLRVFRHFLGLALLPPIMAQDLAPTPAAAKVPFRAAARSGDVLLRDSDTVASLAKFPLPAGGQELALQGTNFTPYDRYFGSVRAVMAALEPERTTMVEACHLMKVGYSFQYVTRDPYRPDPPKLTAAQKAGDCKSKALWLFDSLSDVGALFVIGKAEKNSRTSHAWVYWRSGGRWWILDCTDRTDPIAADSVSSDRYIPYYSFGKNGTYRHPSTRADPTPGTQVSAAPASARGRPR